MTSVDIVVNTRTSDLWNESDLIRQLGLPTEDNFQQNPASLHQHEASAPPAGHAVDSDRPTENASNILDLNAGPPNPHPTPPTAAPTQEEYTPTLTGNRGTDNTKCSGAAFGCPELAINCVGRGRKWHFCRLIRNNSDLVTVPPTEAERNKELAIHRKKPAREKAAQRRAAEKRAKAADALATMAGVG